MAADCELVAGAASWDCFRSHGSRGRAFLSIGTCRWRCQARHWLPRRVRLCFWSDRQWRWAATLALGRRRSSRSLDSGGRSGQLHHNSDWRGAVQAINRLGFGVEMPVIVPSPFIEAREPEWSSSYSLPGFLYAHLLVYPVTGTPVLLPYTGGACHRSNLAAVSALRSMGRMAAFVRFGNGWKQDRSSRNGVIIGWAILAT